MDALSPPRDACHVDLLHFLMVLLGGLPGFIEVRAIKEPRPAIRNGWYAHSWYFCEPRQLVGWLTEGCGVEVSRKAGLFFGPARRSRPPMKPWMGGRDEDVTELRCLWTDLDAKMFAGGFEEAAGALYAIKPVPTAVVQSGGGYHAYWSLREPATPAAGRALMQRLALHLNADASCANPSRVLRLPASWHRKEPANPRQIVLVNLSARRRYTVADFGGLPQLPTPTAPPTAPRPLLRIGPEATRGHRYAAGALRRQYERISSATQGNRHRGLYAGAASLAPFITAGLLAAPEVEATLLAAVQAAGYGADQLDDARKTIADGLARGALEPLPVKVG